MKTRAILQTSPFKTRDGKLVASAIIKTGKLNPYSVTCGEKHADLKPGDTITVERHGSEWRAV